MLLVKGFRSPLLEQGSELPEARRLPAACVEGTDRFISLTLHDNRNHLQEQMVEMQYHAGIKPAEVL